ncbi:MULTISPECIES: FAD-dependent monooxygenase [Paenibacillus]|nr:FAD-dependent monooxygenase [Paenibacillus anaericanus]
MKQVMESDICIVGGGPAGSLLACLLVQSGASVILLEKQSVIGSAFRGEILNDVGEQLLRRRELLQKIPVHSRLSLEEVQYWFDKQIVNNIVPDQPGGNVGIHIPQRDMLTVLIEEAKAYPHFTYLSGITITALMQNQQGQFNGIMAKGKDGQIVEIHSSVVVGADGRYSTVRKLADIPLNKNGLGYDLLWARIPAPEGWRPVIRSTIVDDQQLHLFTQAGGFIQIGWNIPKGTYTELRKDKFEPFVERLIRSFPDLAEQVQEHIVSWEDFVLLDIFGGTTPTWAKSGLVLIGDAVHTMTPTGAFGLNEALLDADILCDELLNALKDNDFSEDRLRGFEAGRRLATDQRMQEQLQMEAEYRDKFIPSTAS